jgi:hypothetical protein
MGVLPSEHNLRLDTGTFPGPEMDNYQVSLAVLFHLIRSTSQRTPFNHK